MTAVDDLTFSEEELPEEDGESVEATLAEMEALQAVFEVDFKGGSVERAKVLAKQAYGLKEPPKNMEGRVTLVSLAYCLGDLRTDLAFVPPTKEGPWGFQTFEAIASGWMRWLVTGSKDKGVLSYITNMPPEEGAEGDDAAETLSLNFWARAIELLVQEERDQAKRFFDKATEVGSQFGTRSNPTICWTYATSFWPT